MAKVKKYAPVGGGTQAFLRLTQSSVTLRKAVSRNTLVYMYIYFITFAMH